MKTYIFLILLISFGCKKYEEGPGISFKSKIERIANTWEVEHVTGSDQHNPNEYEGFYITFTSEGYYFYHPAGPSKYVSPVSGTWTLANNQRTIQITYSNNEGKSVLLEYEIIKLKENEMWIKDKHTGFQLRLIPS